MCHLSRRLTVNEQEPRSLEGADPDGLGHTGSTGVLGKLPQIAANACTGGRVPGIPHQLNAQGIAAAQNKGRSDKIRGRPGAKPGRSLSQAISSTDWQAISSHSSSLPSTTSLQKPTNSETQSTGQLGLRRNYQVVIRGRGGPAMVGEQLNSLEWPESVTALPILCDRDRRLQYRLGSLSPRGGNGRVLGPGRTETPYQLTRTVGSLLCAEVLFEEGGKYRSANQIGQYSCGVIHQQVGWHKVPKADSVNETDICMVPTQANQSIGPTPAREGEPNCGFFVQAPERQDRLDAQRQDFQSHQPVLGPLGGRPLCDKIFSSAEPILQLESRSRGLADRCIHPTLDSPTSICSPPMVLDLQSTNEDTNGRSHNRANHPSLESTTMVSGAALHDNRLPNTSTEHSRPSDSFFELRLSSEGQSPTSGRLEGIRRHLASRKISTAATKLILTSWRDKTNTQHGGNGRSGAESRAYLPLLQTSQLS